MTDQDNQQAITALVIDGRDIAAEGKQEETNRISVPKEQLALLINQKKELQFMTAEAVELIAGMFEILGGKMPKDPLTLVSKLPGIVRKLRKDDAFIARMKTHIENIIAIAPNHLSEELINKLNIPTDNE